MPEQFPVASAEWQRLISLPLFPDMTEEERAHVVRVAADLCSRYAIPSQSTIESRRPKPR